VFTQPFFIFHRWLLDWNDHCEESAFSDLTGQRDSIDFNFLQRFVNGGQTININAILPDDKSPKLDLSYFKGNQSNKLAAEIKIGTSVFEDDIDFNGMLINGDQGLAFNFNVFLNDRELSFMKVGEEKILEIEITAKGDKIVGITTIK